MALSKVSFTTASGGLGRLPLGEDYISALIGTVASGAAGFLTTDLMKEYRSLAEVEAAGITQGSANALIWYHAREYFRIAGPSVLWIINLTNYNLEAVIDACAGKIRRIGYVAPVTNTNVAAEVAAKQVIAAAFDTAGCPLSILLGIADNSIANYSALVDLRTLNSSKVSVISMGDGNGVGHALATTLSLTGGIPAIGTILGAMALAAVNESIAWVEKFNLSDGTEFVKVRNAKGVVATETEAVLTGIDTKGYILFRTFIGLSGVFANFGWTATTITNDYATIENNATIDKAKRLIKTTFITDLNSPLTLEANGKLAADTVKYFENKAATQLDNMQNAGEISNYSVLVDPEQNVLSTSILKIQVRIQPRGVAKEIQINIGLAATVSLN